MKEKHEGDMQLPYLMTILWRRHCCKLYVWLQIPSCNTNPA